jgi:hypothetical protein
MKHPNNRERDYSGYKQQRIRTKKLMQNRPQDYLPHIPNSAELFRSLSIAKWIEDTWRNTLSLDPGKPEAYGLPEAVATLLP